MGKIKKTDHFYLIDGSGYIFRAYYALPPLTRKSDGLPVGAVSGFCNMLFKLLEDSKSSENLEKPTHFAVIFDSARKNFRNEIYSDYKGNRSDAPDDLIPQFDYIRKSVLAFNLPSIEMLNYEADDLIATYVEQILDEGAKVTIVSSDKDLMQLFKKKVRIYDPMKNKFISNDDVINKFGVGPDKVIDVQSLAGDSTDNVPGVPGIGVKTAAELIKEYGNLENLLKNANKIKQNKRRETLLENKDKALVSKKLVTLKNDVPVKDKLTDFVLKKVDVDKLYNFLREMEFNRLLSSAISTYGQSKFSDEIEVKKETSKISKDKYFLIKNLSEIKDWMQEAEEAGEFSIDTETDSLDPHQANLVGISISSKIGKACYIPTGHIDKNNLNEKDVLRILKPYLEDKSLKKIGQNIKFDYIIFRKRDIDIQSMEDTMLMSYVLDAGKNRHNMDTLSDIHLGHKTIKYKDLVGSGKKEIKFSQVELNIAKDYAAEDADITYRLYKIFLKSLKSEKLLNIYASLKKTKKGSFATGAAVLEDLAYKGNEFPKLVLEWRQSSKLKNTYSDSLPEHLNPNTKRVHTSFLLAATTTGRLASSDPNLQNIPIKTEEGKDIRKAFISEKNKKLISADYNQIEMRILADLADVKELKKAFKNNEDIHSLTASQVFGADIKKIDADMRRKAKAINFGIIYGISQYGLAKQIGVSNNEAEEFLNSYFIKFPEIKEYMNNTIKFCRKSGYVRNIFGRKTHIPGINDKNFNVRNFQERAAINAPIQGSASEIMRLAMIRINDELDTKKTNEFNMLLQIHDELIFEVIDNGTKSASKKIKDIMTSVKDSDLHSFSIPLSVDVNIGDNWGELH